MSGEPLLVHEIAGGTRRRHNVGWVVTMCAAPALTAAAYFFWVGLDNPPLEALGQFAVVVGVVATATAIFAVSRNAGAPSLLAAVIAVGATVPALYVAAFIVIAGAFGFGGMIGEVF